MYRVKFECEVKIKIEYVSYFNIKVIEGLYGVRCKTIGAGDEGCTLVDLIDNKIVTVTWLYMDKETLALVL